VAKNQIKEGIRRQNDNPIQVGIREFLKLLCGEDHPRGRTPTFSTVDRLTRDHMVEFHRRHFRPNRMILGVAGDFDPDQMIRKLERAFGSWQPLEQELPPIPSLPYPTTPSVNFVRKDVPQSTIIIGHLGIKQDNPDHHAVEVMNSILGGSGFSSRIVETIRNDRGLAYFAGSFYQVGALDAGAFLGISLTQAESTTVALELLLDEVKKIREEEVEEEELETAKNMRLNSEVFAYDSPEEIVNRLVYLKYYDLPEDYYERSLTEVAGLDRATIQRVAQEYLYPDRMIILTVGDVDKYGRPLSDFGEPVNEITLDDPTAQ
jgi:zinc protease